MSRNNLHTHTSFCDGKDSPGELVKYALSRGCEYIGFSGHSYTNTFDDEPFCMTKEGTIAYKKEIRRLQNVFAGKIKILLGVEQDYFSDEPTSDYDYVIGSVHYVFKDGKYLSVDESRQSQIDTVNRYYGGDFYAFAEDYYSLVGKIYEKTKCTIVGHFDLISKFNEACDLFDPAHPRYIKAADNALKNLLDKPVKFEVNYGAIARGYRKSPYPEQRIIDLIDKAGKQLVYTSDCHSKEMLLFGIPDLQ